MPQNGEHRPDFPIKGNQKSGRFFDWGEKLIPPQK